MKIFVRTPNSKDMLQFAFFSLRQYDRIRIFEKQVMDDECKCWWEIDNRNPKEMLRFGVAGESWHSSPTGYTIFHKFPDGKVYGA